MKKSSYDETVKQLSKATNFYAKYDLLKLTLGILFFIWKFLTSFQTRVIKRRKCLIFFFLNDLMALLLRC